MSDRDTVSDQDGAGASVTQCELQLERAQEDVRRAAETLRRAIRSEKCADGELTDAEHRLQRRTADRGLAG